MDPFRKIRKLAGKAIGDYDMIEDGDFILAALSGGKDSMILLLILDELRRKAPVGFRLEAATFDPGFEGFDAGSTHTFCESLGIPHHIVKLNVAPVIERTETERKPCVLCSRLRRGNLYALAKRIGANKIALGQHLDDIAVSFFISACRGGGLTTMGPNVSSDDASLRVIRPLAYAEEKLIAEAAREKEIVPHGECRYKKQLEETGDRAYFKRLLRQMEREIPDLLQNLLHSLSDIRPAYLLDRRFIPEISKKHPKK